MFIIYALEQGETERYNEVFLTDSARNENEVEEIKEIAKCDGYHSFRVVHYDQNVYEYPDFSKTIKGI